MAKPVLLINPHAGPRPDPRRVQRVQRALRLEGVRAETVEFDDGDLRETVRRVARSRPRAVIVAGGDGSIGAAAHALAGTPVPLGILPLGTRNHFAKDVGIPWRLRPAARAIARGRPATIDVADVNGLTFVNNASLGLYPRMVVRRRRESQRLGRNKWVASAYAAAAVLRHQRLVDVRLETERGTLRATTPFLFVGNNPYEFETFRLGRRRSLASGRLGVYLAGPLSSAGVLALPFRALAGRLRAAHDFRALETRAAFVEAPRSSLRVAIDGEVYHVHPPLRFRTRPRSLRVFIPPRRRRA